MANGLVVFLVGLLVQVALVRYLGLSHVVSYIIQTIFSVQLNFVLSRFVTWRDRNVRLGRAFVRFNVQQLTSTGLGMALYAGLVRFGMNYIEANVAVTTVLTPVSFVVGHRWSMTGRTTAFRLRALPWPLIIVLVVQTLLSLRLIWSNTAYADEALYLYSGSQELRHWLQGIPVEDYQDFFSGSPAVYPPLAAIANAVAGLAGARILSLSFVLGSTTLLYSTTARLFDKRAALLGTSVFAALGVTQFLGALATYDAMAMFLLTLSAYLVIGRVQSYDTLTDVACSTVIAAACLALANADKYATALWDPVVIGLALCAPAVNGFPWRYGVGRALRFAIVLIAYLGVGLAVGKSKYIQGILYTTVNRSSRQAGMGQPVSLVLHDTWVWAGVMILIAALGALLLLRGGRPALAWMGVLLFAAAVAAPLNQARIGTSVSLQKHVVFGAWFGCIIAGYALSRILRNRTLAGVGTTGLLLVASVAYSAQATSLYGAWPHENPAYIATLRKLLKPGTQRYLIEGYADIPAYYLGPSINSIQWKEAVRFSYTDPQSGVTYLNGPAFEDAVKQKFFNLIILNFTEKNDYQVASDITKYGGYKVIAHLPPSSFDSTSYYTVWARTGGSLWDS